MLANSHSSSWFVDATKAIWSGSDPRVGINAKDREQ